MKLHWFHLMPYPELPEDFAEKYRNLPFIGVVERS